MLGIFFLKEGAEKNPKDFFWILIHCDDSIPNKIYDNTLVIHPSKGNILNGLIKIFSYFLFQHVFQ